MCSISTFQTSKRRLIPTITLKCHGRRPLGMAPTSSKEVLQPGSSAHTASGCPVIRPLGACLTEQRTLDAARPVRCLRATRDPQRSAATPCAAQSGAGAPQSFPYTSQEYNVQRADGIGFADYAKNHLTAIFFTLPLRPTVPRTVDFPICRRLTPVVCIDRNCGIVRDWSAASGAARTGGGGSGGHGIGTTNRLLSTLIHLAESKVRSLRQPAWGSLVFSAISDGRQSQHWWANRRPSCKKPQPKQYEKQFRTD